MTDHTPLFVLSSMMRGIYPEAYNGALSAVHNLTGSPMHDPAIAAIDFVNPPKDFVNLILVDRAYGTSYDVCVRLDGCLFMHVRSRAATTNPDHKEV